VEVVDGSAGVEDERVLVVRLLGGRDVGSGLEHRPAGGAEGLELDLRERHAGGQLVTEVLAVVGLRREATVGVETLAAPLNAAAAP